MNRRTAAATAHHHETLAKPFARSIPNRTRSHLGTALLPALSSAFLRRINTVSLSWLNCTAISAWQRTYC